MKYFIFIFVLLSCHNKKAKLFTEKIKKPNIIFILSDDHATSTISAYGSKINKTPNIDEIAKNGILFKNSFCANSICGPSRATIITGKHSNKNGFYTNNKGFFDNKQKTLPKYFQKYGYSTAIIGKWHLKSKPTGFDYWDVLPGQGHYYNPIFIRKGSSKKVKHYGYSTDIITKKSLNWIKNRKDKKPFFLMCNFKAAHRTWMPNFKNLNLYKNTIIPEPQSLFDDYSNRHYSLKKAAMKMEDLYSDYDLKIEENISSFNLKLLNNKLRKNPEYLRVNKQQKQILDKAYQLKDDLIMKKNFTSKEATSWIYQRYVKDYLRVVASIDENIGKILKYLKKNNQLENTIIVYSSDQGFYLGEHGWFDKRWMFEESLKMPFIISWKGHFPKKITRNELIQNIDYAPTFLDIIGADIPKDMQGKSFLPLLSNKKVKNWRNEIYYHYYEHLTTHKVPAHEGVRSKRYKLIHFYKSDRKEDKYNFFDLKKDPNELVSIHNDFRYKEIFKEYIKKLKKLRKKYNLP